MMMECPRCGFVQPQDRYCANCGLNIETYHAKPKPLIERLGKNPAFHIGLAVLLIFGIIVYLQKNRNLPPPSTSFSVAAPTAAPVAGSTPPATPSEPTSTPPDAAANQETEPATDRRPPPTAAPSAATNSSRPEKTVTLGSDSARTEAEAKAIAAITATTSANEPAPSAGADAAEPAVKPPGQIEVQFYEIPRESFAKLSAESKVSLENPSLRVLALNSAERLSPLLSNVHRLQGARTMGSQASTSMALQFTVGPGAQAQGLAFDLTIVKSDRDSWSIEIAGVLELKHESRPPSPAPAGETHNKFEGTVQLPFQGALVLTGFLPHKTVSDALMNALKQTPLEVLSSPDFILGDSELIAVVQAK